MQLEKIHQVSIEIEINVIETVIISKKTRKKRKTIVIDVQVENMNETDQKEEKVEIKKLKMRVVTEKLTNGIDQTVETKDMMRKKIGKTVTETIKATISVITMKKRETKTIEVIRWIKRIATTMTKSTDVDIVFINFKLI